MKFENNGYFLITPRMCAQLLGDKNFNVHGMLANVPLRELVGFIRSSDQCNLIYLNEGLPSFTF